MGSYCAKCGGKRRVGKTVKTEELERLSRERNVAVRTSARATTTRADDDQKKDTK